MCVLLKLVIECCLYICSYCRTKIEACQPTWESKLQSEIHTFAVEPLYYGYLAVLIRCPV